MLVGIHNTSDEVNRIYLLMTQSRCNLLGLLNGFLGFSREIIVSHDVKIEGLIKIVRTILSKECPDLFTEK